MFEIQLAVSGGALMIDVDHFAIHSQAEQNELALLVQDFSDNTPTPPPIKKNSSMANFGSNVPNPPPMK